MQIIFNDRHVLHPTHETNRRPNDTFEVPARVEAIRQAVLHAELGPLQAPQDHGLEPILAVHNPAYIRFLREAYERQTQAEGQRMPLFPDIFPTRNALRIPQDLPAAAGYYAADADSPILERTWEAAYWSAQCALTAADRVRAGAKSVYALCRPPGHHAYADMYGGFCYLNNAAIAARYLQHTPPSHDLQRPPLLPQLAPHPLPVAILDIDYHHGNGTQSIFYSDPTVLLCSLHAHPDSDYPYYSGMADECGAGVGAGLNRNWPLARGTQGPAYLAALDEAIEVIRTFSPRFLVVSTGFDISAGDPYGGFRLTHDDLRAIGNRIARLGQPTVLIQEGGYLLQSLGEQAVCFLSAFL
jgi:acetoin utilization deacetylase AcuC-like enzyme